MSISAADVLRFVRTAKWGYRFRIQEKRHGRKQTFRSLLQRGAAKPRRLDGISRSVQRGRSQELMSELQRDHRAL